MNFSKNEVTINVDETSPIKSIDDYPDILDVQDVQNILRIGKSLCYKLIKTMPHIKVGKSYRVSKKYIVKTYFCEE